MKVLGHRGVIKSSDIPYQNSLRSFSEAIDKIDGFETDACLSSDGEIYFIHEAKYYDVEVEICYQEHLQNPDAFPAKRFDQLSSDQVAQLRLKDGQPIPNWAQTLKLFENKPDKIFNIELKGYNVHTALIPKLKEAINSGRIKEEQFVISSFNHRVLVHVREAFPNIQIGVLYVDPTMKPAYLFPWTDDKIAAYEPLNETTLQADYLTAIKPQYVIIPDSCASEESFTLIKKHLPQCKVVVWVFTELNSYDDDAFHAMLNKQKSQLHAVIIDNPDVNYTIAEKQSA
jgi:glycerophosphoryl diester phosphodiesterase